MSKQIAVIHFREPGRKLEIDMADLDKHGVRATESVLLYTRTDGTGCMWPLDLVKEVAVVNADG